MYLVRSYTLMYVQVPQVVMNLIFSYRGRDFSPQVPALKSIHSRGVGREADRGTEAKLLSTSGFFSSIVTGVSHVCH